tara:strand:+ start:461 stop:826 length:366 start_codon:yes stop_codon:yes gene_type:complete
MKHLFTHVSRVSAALTVALGTTITYAAEYGGGGLTAGAADAGAIVGGTTDIHTTVTDIIIKVLEYMALAALAVIVLAGILMVISGGDDEKKERAKRMILFVVIGLIIILLAQGIVEIVRNL